jgi:hypothetical protein
LTRSGVCLLWNYTLSLYKVANRVVFTQRMHTRNWSIVSNRLDICWEIAVFLTVIWITLADRRWWKEQAVCEATQYDKNNMQVMSSDLRQLFSLYAITMGLHAFVISLQMVCIRAYTPPSAENRSSEIRYVRIIEYSMRTFCDFMNFSVLTYRIMYPRYIDNLYSKEMYPIALNSRINWTFWLAAAAIAISTSMRMAPLVYTFVMSYKNNSQ